MATASAIESEFGKSACEQSGERFPQIGETSIAVINKIKEMYAHPAVVFGRWLGLSDKTAKRKLNHERALTVEELGVLIRSEQGFEIVAAVMGNATPKWWRLMVPIMDAATAREAQLIARRQLKKTIESALDADRNLTATIQFAEALSDQDFVRPQLDALRSVGGVQNRALARGRK